jgi:dTDP-4-amino-4,6-dideoxygalactose transaminase
VEIDAAVGDVLENSQFILGPQVSSLEKEIAAYHGIPHAVGVASGTDALLLALNACGIAEGDEVITTPFTFIATAEVVSHLKAVPVFVDIEEHTFNIDPQKIEALITDKTKAIIPVHLYGHPADMDSIMALAGRYNLRVIEDCAQAFGALYKGKKVGTFGDFGCFSFFPSKNLACYGDGGMVIAKDETLCGKIKLLRNHGSAVRYHHKILGYNSRLDEIQAAILRVKLKRIDTFNEARRAVAAFYKKHIQREDIILPGEAPECKHVYHQFTILSEARDRISDALTDHGIASAIYYPIPLHLQDVFARENVRRGKLQMTESCAGKVLSLPIFPELREDEVLRISEVINHAL